MKRIILAVVAVLLIAGAGAAAWFFFIKAKPEDHVRDDVHETAGKPEFLELDSLSVPVIRGGRLDKYIMLRLTLEMKDAKAKAVGKEAMPLVKDAFLRDLHGFFADQPPTDEGIDVRLVKARLMRVSERLFGPGQVVNVLVQGAFEREWKPQ